jgi:transposase InsO family protein
MAAANSLPSSNKPASSGACAYSFCLRAPPKLNGAVERAQRTHTEAFYQVTDCSLEMAALNRELRAWEKTYNTVRPHQSLGYLTPLRFL